LAVKAAKNDQKVFESLVAEIKKSIKQTRDDVDQHNEMLKQLKKELFINTEDLLREERERNEKL
jgi:hypothetical protein